MTPAERLLKAAEILEKRANEATAGTWEAELLPERWDGDRPAYWVKFEHADDDGGSTSGTIAECPWGMADARYIATMHPEVGKAVAAWLRWASNHGYPGLDTRALHLADLVLAAAGDQAGES